MHSKRVASAVVLVLVAVLVVVLVAVGISPSSSRTDPLVLNGRAPRFAEVAFDVTTSGTRTTTGTLWLDLVTSRVRATLMVPVVTAATEIDLREADNHVYLTSPNLADASGPVWYSQPVHWPSLRGLAPVLLRPNAAVLSLLATARVVHQGGLTTYELTRHDVSLGSFSTSAPTLPGTLELRVTTGRQGEFTALWARLISPTSSTTIGLSVISYHPQVSFAPPSTRRASPPAGPLLQQLVHSGALGSLIVPTQLLQLVAHHK